MDREDYEELVRMLAELAEIDHEARLVSVDWDLPEHVRSRSIIDIETNELL